MDIGVSFDVWGTLLDLRKAYARIASRIAEATGREPGRTLEELLDAAREARRARRSRGSWSWEDGARIASQRLGVDLELFNKLVEEALTRKPEELVKPGVFDALEAIRAARIPAVILGNVLFWPGSLTRRILEEAGIARYMKALLFADEIGAAKPDARAFEKAAEALGVPLEKLVHVGDRVDEDVAGALLAGGYAILAWAEIDTDYTCIHRRLCAVKRISYTPFILARIRSSL